MTAKDVHGHHRKRVDRLNKMEQSKQSPLEHVSVNLQLENPTTTDRSRGGNLRAIALAKAVIIGCKNKLWVTESLSRTAEIKVVRRC